MNILAVETATARQSVAVLRGDEVAACLEKDAEGSHARWIIPTLDAVLKTAGLTVRDLDGLAVSIGPGSFTGLRVGLATALGLRAVTGVPLIGVPTLEAMAWRVPEVGPDVCPIIKARTGEAYWAVYRWTRGNLLVRVQEARVGPVALIPASLAPARPTVMLGDGWLAYEPQLRPLCAAGAAWIRQAPAERVLTSAVSVARAAMGRLERGETLPRGFSPQYLQRSEAELSRERARVAQRRVRGARRIGDAAPSR